MVRPALIVFAAASFAVCSGGLPWVASADSIRMPADCPGGWEARRVGHGGYCVPTPCESAADCDGRACLEVARCYLESRIPSGRSRRNATWSRPLEETCEDGTCARGECETRRECAPPNAAPEPAAPTPTAEPRADSPPPAAPAPGIVEPADEGFCSVAASPVVAAGWLVVSGLLLLGRRRRR